MLLVIALLLLQLISTTHAWTPGFHGPGGGGTAQRKDNDLAARPMNATAASVLTLEGDLEDQVEQAIRWQEQEQRLRRSMPQPGNNNNKKKKATSSDEVPKDGKHQKQQKVNFKRGLDQEWERFEKERK